MGSTTNNDINNNNNKAACDIDRAREVEAVGQVLTIPFLKY